MTQPSLAAGQSVPNLESVRREYVDDASLGVRYLTHRRYTVDPVDFVEWTLDCVAWRGDERVLDVGCGPGDLLRAMARRGSGWGLLAGLDFSAGMARRAAAQSAGLPIHFLAADAAALPVPAGSFDVVMARHMLYYVPDLDRALAEAVRVLCPGGRFLATTNSAATMPEYQALMDRLAAGFPDLLQDEGRPEEHFSLENAPALLGRHLDGVQTHVLRGVLRFPAARPLVEYIASGRLSIARPGHTDAEWQAAEEWLTAAVDEHIARHGHFDVTKIAGAVVGVERG